MKRLTHPIAGARPPGLLIGVVLVVALLAAALALVLRGARSDRALTVTLPAPVQDRIWGAPIARGRPIVVLDPGHGGSDPGARSASGEVAEKDLTLQFARELRDLLVERGRVRVAMTRDDDRYVPLDDRPAVARRLNAAMFVSLHMDSATNPEARGGSVYSLADVASDAEAARLASVQNRIVDRSQPAEGEAAALMADLALRSEMTASADLAARLVDQAIGRVSLRPQPHRFASFHVLRRADSPAVLFEAGYLSNSADEAQLRSPEYRRRLALALAQAIEGGVAARLVR